MTDTAAGLAIRCTESPVQTQPIDGGWRVHSTATFHVDILKMLGSNLRMVTTPVDRPWEYTRGWCYQRPLTEVVLAAMAFNPDIDAAPVGWIKEIETNRRPCGWLIRSTRKEHYTYDPDCPECGDTSLA